MRRRLVLRACLPVLALLAGCARGDRDPGIWFVHATDPHLFEAEDGAAADAEGANQRAFESLLTTIRALPGSDAEPEFLLLTGDLGYGEANSAPGGTTEARVERLASILSQHPGLTVYVVPGNNDVRDERARELQTAHQFLAQVQERVRPAGVALHDLTSCYLDQPGGTCTADIADTRFRLIGFPTFSFKNKRDDEAAAGDADESAAPPATIPDPSAVAPEGEDAPPQPPSPSGEREQPGPGGDGATGAGGGDDAEHAAWMTQLGELVEVSGRQGKRVLLATHVSDLNDPYLQAQGMRSEAAGRPVAAARPAPWAAWDVPRELFAQWREIVGSPVVARVLAGHFHDSHREIYRAPYSWERNPAGLALVPRADREKIWLAPPLGERLQLSPFQARGFALVHLAGTDTERRLYWYDQAENGFEPEAEEAQRSAAGERRGWRFLPVVRWLWELGDGSSDLGKSAVLAIALLVAFLTVIAVWQIPPPRTVLAEAATREAAAEPPPISPSSVFTSNFSRTVLGGLAGLAGITILENVWKDQRLDHLYYVICFVILFLSLLLLSAVLRGLIEALRSRLASPRFQQSNTSRGLKAWFRFWLRRSWEWLWSLRPTLLVFGDTALNLLQGKNQLETAVLGNTILDLQKSLVETVDRIAAEVQRAVNDALERADSSVGTTPCRVNVSVLAPDQNSLSYVSLARGSLLRRFDQRSVAWIAVAAARKPRWWRKAYEKDLQEIVLFDNKETEPNKRLLQGWEPKITLQSCLQDRGLSDYEAFVVFPLPWFRGGRTKRQGALHISFAKEKYLELLWDGLAFDEAKKKHLDSLYEHARELLTVCPSSTCSGELPHSAGGKEENGAPDLLGGEEGAATAQVCMKDACLQAVLAHAVAVLPEVLAEFNEVVFEHLIHPRE